jgi:hypothetical protein
VVTFLALAYFLPFVSLENEVVADCRFFVFSEVQIGCILTIKNLTFVRPLAELTIRNISGVDPHVLQCFLRDFLLQPESQTLNMDISHTPRAHTRRY